MDIVFHKNSFDQDYQSVSRILTLGSEYDRAKNFLCKSFNLDFDFIKKNSGTKEEIDKYLQPILKQEYLNAEPVMNKKLNIVSDKWDDIKFDVERILNKTYECTYPQEQAAQVYFTINYMGPYDYETKSFQINFRKKPEEMIEACIHEIIHFYWFYKWDELFKDRYKEYEHLIWQFSEIAIDAIFEETELKKYCVKERPAYQYFYDIEIEHNNMIEFFRKLFIENDIQGYMKKGIEFIIKNKYYIYIIYSQV